MQPDYSPYSTNQKVQFPLNQDKSSQLSIAGETGFLLDATEIDLIVYDFDGVMTDNTVMVSETGNESVLVNRSDGLAIKTIKSKGIRQLIMSTEQNKIVRVRAAKLDIPVLWGANNKKEALSAYCFRNSLSLGRVVYIGNDLNDVEVMRLVAYPLAPSDAYPEVKEIAHFIIPAAGGKGVVRELLNHIKFREV